MVRDLEPSMGAEDFSFMLQTKPGAYLRGQGMGASGAPCTTAAMTSMTISCRWVLPHASLIERAMPLPTAA